MKDATSTIAVFRKHKGKIEVLVGKKRGDQSKLVSPGGYLDKGEGALEGALRELEEETGIKAKSLKRIGKRSFGDKNDALFATVVDADTKTKAADDLGSLKWYDIQKMPDLSLGHGDIVHKAVKSLFQDNPLVKIQDSVTESPSKKGLLIVFEGIDGAGKSTQIENLEQWLNEQGFKYIMSKWNSSKLMESSIKYGKKKQMLSPLLFSLLHCADMVVRYESDILPALTRNKIVLCDRYVYTSMARDQVRGVDPDLIKKIYKGFHVPDVIFHCDTPPEIAFSRVVKEKGLNYYSSGMDLNLADNKEESCLKYEKMVAKIYDEMLPKVKGYVKLDTTQNEKAVFAEIKRVLERRFGIGKE